MDLSIFKNPIFLAIIVTALTYMYLYWENKKKQDENPKANIEPISITTPIIVGLLTLFIAYNYFGMPQPNIDNSSIEELYKNKTPELVQNAGNIAGKALNEINLLGKTSINKMRLSDRMTDSFGSNTFHLIDKNVIRLPQTDVFIDIAKF